MSVTDTIFTCAERYCITLPAEFSDPARLTVEALNNITDDWIKSVVLEIDSPGNVALACMIASHCINEGWLSPRFGFVFWTLGFEGITSNLVLFKYMLWRFEKYVGEQQQSEEVVEETADSEPSYSDVEDLETQMNQLMR